MTTTLAPGPQCPKCASYRVRFRHRTQDHICDRCGHVWPKAPAASGADKPVGPTQPRRRIP